MRTSEERVAELHRRMEGMRQAKARRRYRLTCAAACAGGLIVAALSAVGVSRLPVQTNAAFGGAAGSIFACHEALGYIVVSLLAFVLGAMVTVFCVRLRRHMEKKGKRDD